MIKKKTDLYEMTPADLAVLEASATNPNLFFEHFFKKPGHEHGWQLDYNFTEEGKWQESMVMATQSFIVAICGIATGKTLGVVMGAAFFAALTQGFKFMNVAKEVYQSMLMYKAILEQAQDCLFEKLIINSPKRPYPQILISFKIGEITYNSSLEFMSLGEKGDATNIFSWRGDWINVEEAGLIDNLDEVVSNLSTRLTGVSADGRSFLGRMTIISNPWDDPILWEYFDMAMTMENGLAFNIETKSNQNVSEKQIDLAFMLIPEKYRSKYLTGGRPEGKGIYFSRENVTACENMILNEKVKQMMLHPEPGWNIVEKDNVGIVMMTAPREEGRLYFEIGDPGIGSAPRRNSPVVCVYDVTDAPTTCPLTAFWWGSGGGSIFPFIDKYMEWMDLYKPIFAGVDNTGPQKSTAELITSHYVYGQNKSVEMITGLDFSGAKKYALLGALRISLEAHMFSWPPLIKGISSQLKKYDPVLDKNENTKLAQDIVSVYAMGAFAIRAYYPAPVIHDEGDDNQVSKPSYQSSTNPRARGYRNSAGRTQNRR